LEQVSSLKTGIKYKNTPIGKIPVDWEAVRLKDISQKFYNGGTPDTTNMNYWNGSIPWVPGSDFGNQKIKQVRKFITNEGVKHSATSVIEKGNLLVVTRTGARKVAIAPFDIAISQDITGVILDPKKAFSEYVYWCLHFNGNRLGGMIQGTSINGLFRGNLESFFVSLPQISEQKKIAEILTTVDNAIEKTDQIIEGIKELKKGLMHKLFTEGIGHRRFKNTKNRPVPEEWKIGKLSDTASVIMGQSRPGNMYNSDQIGAPVLNGPDEFTDYFPVPVQYTTKPAKMCKKGDILFCVRGSDAGRMNMADREYCIGRRLAAIRQKRNSNTKFIYYVLTDMTKKIFAEVKVAGSTYSRISRKGLENIPMIIPPLDEQERIANILEGVDVDLKKEQDYKSEIERIKLGLMQVLLTGKLRVKEPLSENLESNS